MNSLPRELQIVTLKITAMQAESDTNTEELDWLMWRKEQIERQIEQENEKCP